MLADLSDLGRFKLKLYSLLYTYPVCEYASRENGALCENVLLIGNGSFGEEAFKTLFSASQFLDDTRISITVLTDNPDGWVDLFEKSGQYPAYVQFVKQKGYADVRFVSELDEKTLHRANYIVNICDESFLQQNIKSLLHAENDNRLLYASFVPERDTHGLPENTTVAEISEDVSDIIQIACNINYSYESKYNQRVSLKQTQAQFQKRLRTEFSKDVFWGGDYNADSSLSSAVHFSTKLKICSLYCAENDPLQTLENAIEQRNDLFFILACSEHRRWNAYTVMRGFYSDPALEAEYCYHEQPNGKYSNHRVEDKMLHMCICDCSPSKSPLDDNFLQIYKQLYVDGDASIRDKLSELDLVSLRAYHYAKTAAEQLVDEVQKIIDSLPNDLFKKAVQRVIDDNYSGANDLYDRQFDRLKKSDTYAQNAPQYDRLNEMIKVFKARNTKMSFFSLDEQVIELLPFSSWFGKRYSNVITVTDKKSPLQDVLMPMLFCAAHAIYITDKSDPEYEKRTRTFFQFRGNNTSVSFVYADLGSVNSIADALLSVCLETHAAKEVVINCVPTEYNDRIHLAIGQITAGTKGTLEVLQLDKNAGIMSFCGNTRFVGMTEGKSLSVSEIMLLLGASFNEYDNTLCSEIDRDALTQLHEKYTNSEEDDVFWTVSKQFFQEQLRQQTIKLADTWSKGIQFEGEISNDIMRNCGVRSLLEALAAYRIIAELHIQSMETGKSTVVFLTKSQDLLECMHRFENENTTKFYAFFNNKSVVVQPLYAEKITCPAQMYAILQNMRDVGLLTDLERDANQRVSFAFSRYSTLLLFKRGGASFENVVFSALASSGLFQDVQLGVEITNNRDDVDLRDELLQLIIRDDTDAYGFSYFLSKYRMVTKTLAERNDVQNEIDIVAVRGTVPFFVSCKDRSPRSLKEDGKGWLYELYTLAAQYGAHPVLVCSCTLDKDKSVVLNRALKMEVSMLGKETLSDPKKLKEALTAITAGKTYSILND